VQTIGPIGRTAFETLGIGEFADRPKRLERAFFGRIETIEQRHGTAGACASQDPPAGQELVSLKNFEKLVSPSSSIAVQQQRWHMRRATRCLQLSRPGGGHLLYGGIWFARRGVRSRPSAVQILPRSGSTPIKSGPARRRIDPSVSNGEWRAG
jgi:hypothetical protein